MPNEKYVNGYGEEAVFNKETGKVINDGINDGTFNIAGGDDFPWVIDIYRHMKGKTSDVGLWVEFGTGPNDPTTKQERQELKSKSMKTIMNLIFKQKAKIAK